MGSEPHSGTEAATAFFTQGHEMLDALEMSLTGPIRVAANTAAFPLQAISTLGETKLIVDIIDVMEFDDDGLVTSLKAYWSFDDTRPYDGP